MCKARHHAWHWVVCERSIQGADDGRVFSEMECAKCHAHKGQGHSVWDGSSFWNPDKWSSPARLRFEKARVCSGEGHKRIWHTNRFYGPAF